MRIFGTFLTLLGCFGLYKLIKGNRSNAPVPRAYQKYIYLVAGLGIFIVGKSDISNESSPIPEPTSAKLISTPSTSSNTVKIGEGTTTTEKNEEQLTLQKKKTE